MKDIKAEIKIIQREIKKQREEAEDKELERRLSPDPVTRAIISHLQAHGSATVDEIVASSPISHLIEEKVEMLYNQGRLKKKGEHYIISGKKYKERYYK
ncbi:hypothetical protein JXB28_04140 [Candidatus Woesearchaeota archaeon]|nr:hypothetical protein [Candidatus Woesearchaeota archaeon]